MRAAAMSVWIFINLLCFGMCGYLYLIWSKYWMYIEKQRLFETGGPQRLTSVLILQDTYTNKYVRNTHHSSMKNKSDARKNKRAAIGSFWSSSKGQPTSKTSGETHPSTTVVRRPHGGPRFPNVHNPILEFDNEKYMCHDYTTDECKEKTAEFKESLLKEFHRVLMGESNVFKSGLEVHNTYNVQYDGTGRKQSSESDILCALSRVHVRTVTAHDEPFKSQGFPIPGDALQNGQLYKTCAVVTSAGALLGSRLGQFIDTHEMVLRFNNAPVVNYTSDVGTKTTFRILNSQVVTKPEYGFLNDPLYRNVSIIIWDPANYSSTLEEWFRHPDFPLFPVYKKLLGQRKGADVHLLKPEVLWDLWTVLQDSSPYRLRRNPPSSGFIGLWFSLQRCERVRIFEYVPSARATRRCHYHRDADDAGCTLGSWHPLAQEKALAERIRNNTDIEVFQRGYIEIPGFTNFKCK